MAYYPYISRAGTLRIGAVNAAKAACADTGSLLKAVWKVEKKTIDAPIEALGGVIGDTCYDTETCSLTLDEQSFSSLNLQRAFGAQVDANGNPFSSGTNFTVVPFGLYLSGFKVDGVAKMLHLPKARISPSSDITQDKSAAGLQYVIEPMGDSTMPYLWSFLDDVTDTVAPTISSVVPADNATAVAKAATTVVVWTFPNVIATVDVNDDCFEIVPTGSGVKVPKAGTLGINAALKVVTFTPTEAWAATTLYACIARNVRNADGIPMAADSVTVFTTGA